MSGDQANLSKRAPTVPLSFMPPQSRNRGILSLLAYSLGSLAGHWIAGKAVSALSTWKAQAQAVAGNYSAGNQAHHGTSKTGSNVSVCHHGKHEKYADTCNDSTTSPATPASTKTSSSTKPSTMVNEETEKVGGIGQDTPATSTFPDVTVETAWPR